MSNFSLWMLVFMIMSFAPGGFKEQQLTHARVRTAYAEANSALLPDLAKATAQKPFSLFLRAFKAEQVVEAWIQPNGQKHYQLFRTYPFCATSGTLGPKRREGDLQIPEGVYAVQHFNPQSNFYLSLGIDYPNPSDKLRGHAQPGSAIYIHGGCATIGCIPITDEKMKELYVLAVEARATGQQTIAVHLFPMRFSDNDSALRNRHPQHEAFWTELQPVFEFFEKKKQVPEVLIDPSGRYQIRSAN